MMLQRLYRVSTGYWEYPYFSGRICWCVITWVIISPGCPGTVAVYTLCPGETTFYSQKHHAVNDGRDLEMLIFLY